MSVNVTTPIAIEHPEIPFDKYAVNFSTAPVWQRNGSGEVVGMEGVASLTLTAYRVLPDGRIDVLFDRPVTTASGAVFAEAMTDPAMGAFVSGFLALVEQYRQARGL